MRHWQSTTLLALIVSSFACGTTHSAGEERYVQAVLQKFEGDYAGYQRTLIALAHEEPRTRAGRRAHQALAGGPSLQEAALVAGVLASSAIPNFTK